MLTNEQLVEVWKRARYAKDHVCSCGSVFCALCHKEIYEELIVDVDSLLIHIKELTQKAFCEHEWIYYFNQGFECSKCKKHKEKK